MEVEEAVAELAIMEKRAAELHEQMMAIKQEKNALTQKISRYYAFLEAVREPSKEPGGTISL